MTASSSVPHAQRLRVLRDSFLFERLPQPDLEHLAARLVARRFAPGQAIFGRGDPGSSMMAVVDGRVRIGLTAAGGREILLTVVGPGEVFGELTALDGQARSADATALGDCTVLALDRRDLLPVLRRSPEAAISLASVVCRRVRAANERLEGALLMTVGARLARLLLRLAERRDGGRPRVRAGLCQSDLGRLIGASRQKVNAHLRRWLKQGILAQEKADLLVRDPARLEAMADAGE